MKQNSGQDQNISSISLIYSRKYLSLTNKIFINMSGFGGWGSHHSHKQHHSGHGHSGEHSPVKPQTNTNLFFDPQPTVVYKILSVLDGNKCWTVNQAGNHNLLLEDYKGTDNQNFHVYHENGKYAFVSVYGNAALHVVGDSNQDGAVIKADPAKFPSNWFQISPVTNGQWAGKACFFKTHGAKAVDIKGGLPASGSDIVQWGHHGGNNQTWVITPAVPQQQGQQIGQQGQQGQQIGQQGQQGQQPIQANFPQAPAVFVSSVNQAYRVVSALDPSKSLTVKATANNKLTLEDYVGDATQKFHIYQQNGKSAFVVTSSNTALCVYMDKKQNNGEIVSDGGKHASSWFDVVAVKAGDWANKAYVIKTFAGKVFDIYGGVPKNGNPVVQWDGHGGNNQSWVILLADQPLPQSNTSQGQGFGQNSQGGQGFGQNSQGGFNWSNIPINPNIIGGVNPNISGGISPNIFGNINSNLIGGLGFNSGSNQGFTQPQQNLFKPNQAYAITSIVNPNKVIDVCGNFKYAGNLIIFDWHGGLNQRFAFESFQGKYRIKSLASGKYVCVTNDAEQDNMWLRVDPLGTKTDLWEIFPATEENYKGKGAYHFKSTFSKGIGIQGSLTNESFLIQSSYNGSESQTWIIKQV